MHLDEQLCFASLRNAHLRRGLREQCSPKKQEHASHLSTRGGSCFNQPRITITSVALISA